MIFRKVMLFAFVLSLLLTGGRAFAQPTITGLQTTTFNPTNDPILTWRLSFSEAVTGVSPANFSLVETGVTATISSVTPLPGNMTWNISVNGIAGDGTLGLNLTNPAGISGSSGPLNQTATGEVYTVDNTSPSVVSITRLDPSPTLATSVDFQINFSEPIYGLTTVNFAVGSEATAAGTVTSISPTADPTIWTGTISNISGSGRLSLDLTDTSGVTDAAGNWLFSDYTAGDRYDIPPQLLCISRLDANPTSATAVRYNITFNAPVTGLSPANFTATGPGGPITDITVTPNPGPAPATDWMVTVGSIAGDGTVQIAMQNPATIQDAAGVSAINVNPLNCNDATYQIDQTAPTASCVMINTPASNATPTSATAVRFAVQFSDPVTGVSSSNFTITATDLTAYTPATWSTADGGLTWTLDITGITEDTSNATNGQIAVAWANTNGIIDAAGNQPALPAGCSPATYDFDQTGPALDCVTREPAGTAEVTSATQVSFRATFSEAVATGSVSAEDFRILFTPTTGLVSATITTVTAVTAGAYSQEFIVELDNIVGNNVQTPPFRYNGNNSIGNGELSIGLAADAEIWDQSGNAVEISATLSASCGNTSYTLDQVHPVVQDIQFANGDCLTSAIFTLVFSEEVTTVTATDLEVIWTGGDCKGTVTVTRVDRTGPSTFAVDVQGSYTLFHLNGPGNIGLRVPANNNIRDVAGNPLETAFESDQFFVCRCFEPAVATAPRAVTTDSLQYPMPTSGTLACASSDHCTSVGILTAPYNDTPTTVTTPDFFQWKATEWDCNSSSPFSIYLDGQYLGSTDGNTSLSLATMAPVGTVNNICAPIGENFHFPIPTPLSPGLHNYHIMQEGSCSSGTLVYFNVLDKPVLGYPTGDVPSCLQPRVFQWDPVDGALGYELFFRRIGAPCATLIDRVTSPTTILEVPDFGLGSGLYEWYVQAYNEYGHQASDPERFRVLEVDPSPPTVFQTDGTIHDIYIDGNVTYLAGEFSLLKIGMLNFPASNIAAVNNITNTPVSMPVVNGAVYTMEPANGYMYIGGNFTRVEDETGTKTQVGRIARLTPNTTSTMVGDYVLDQSFKPGANGPVRAIEVIGQKVYYAGDFTKVGVQVYNFGNFAQQVDAVRVAIATMTTSDELTSPPESANLNPNATVYDLLSHDGSLYVAGAFSTIGGKDIQGLARTSMTLTGEIDPTFNANIEAGISHYVYSIQIIDDKLYFGGSFSSVLDEPRQNAANVILSQTTSTVTVGDWNPQPQGAVHIVRSQGPGMPIYIGGTFTSLRQERFTYMAGVDPVIGYGLSCSFNADRPVFAIDIRDTGRRGTEIHIGGQATTTGP